MKEIEYEKIVRYEKDLKEIIQFLFALYLTFITGIGIGYTILEDELLGTYSIPTIAFLILVCLVVFFSRKVTWRKVK
jgi:hypothetical protein